MTMEECRQCRQCGKQPRRRLTYTKKIMNSIITAALIDMQLPFILAFLGREQIAETLGGIIATEIVAVFLVYCLKSYNETKEEEKNKLSRKESIQEVNT